MKYMIKYLTQNKRDLLFYIAIILNTLILFGTKYFPTLDGGAHSYNAKIMASLMFGDGGVYKDFFQMNTELVPNWFASALIMIFNTFLSPEASEKSILLIYFIAFPLLLKSVVDKLTEQKNFLVFMVFPFTHFALIYYGFFNFAYGILFFLLAILFWIKNENSLTIKKIILFSLLCLLTYFSHLFAFMSLLIFFTIKETYVFIYAVAIDENKKNIKDQFKTSVIRASKLLLCSIIPLILTFIYFKNRPSVGAKNYLSSEALNQMLTSGTILKSFNPNEDYTAGFIFYLICVLFVYILFSKIKVAIDAKKVSAFFAKQDVFLFGGVAMLYLFYTQPDSDGYGAFISLRFILYTFIFLIIWIASNKLDKILHIMSVLSLIICMYSFVKVKRESVKWLNTELKKLDGVAPLIKDGSIVVPVNFASYNWLGTHFSNYLAARKKIIVTENFEASTEYFPVLWKSHQMPLLMPNDIVSEDECNGFIDLINNYQYGKVNYVFIYGDPKAKEFNNKFAEKLLETYKLIYSFQDVYLYERI